MVNGVQMAGSVHTTALMEGITTKINRTSETAKCYVRIELTVIAFVVLWVFQG